MNSILIVDDEPGILDVCQKALSMQGYTVKTALNALIGLEILNKEKIDMVISDLKMPVMDGLTFCDKVKEKWPETGFILITGFWSSNFDEIEENKSKLNGVLKKPFELTELIQSVQQFLNEKDPH